MLRNRLAKIVATVGPASAAPDQLKLLHEVGVDAFRLNFSHGDRDTHAKAVSAIRDVEKTSGDAISIIADMQGPKLRVGTFENGTIDLRYGEDIMLELSDKPGKDGLIRIRHKEIFACLEPGHILKIDDGKLQVTVRKNTGTQITGRVDIGGPLGERKGINVIGAVLPMSAMTEKDKLDMKFALAQNVDYIALSFVQTIDDVLAAKKIVGDRAGLIVKIEKPSAVEHLEEILQIADAAMVARGDLGVELPLEQVPVMQRRIIRTARAQGKPVIVATHMLESMINAATPTRAEASDVATAIYQGTDAVMLSAETAVGRHPATTVAIMDRIIRAAESDPSYSDVYFRSLLRPQVNVNDAISQSIRSMADILGCKLVIGYTKTGSTVKRIARQRPSCPILGLTPEPRVASRMALTWGVRPVVMNDPKNFDEMLAKTQDIAKQQGACVKGDKIIVAAGIPFGRPGTTDTLKIATIE